MAPVVARIIRFLHVGVGAPGEAHINADNNTRHEVPNPCGERDRIQDCVGPDAVDDSGDAGVCVTGDFKRFARWKACTESAPVVPMPLGPPRER